MYKHSWLKYDYLVISTKVIKFWIEWSNFSVDLISTILQTISHMTFEVELRFSEPPSIKFWSIFRDLFEPLRISGSKINKIWFWKTSDEEVNEFDYTQKTIEAAEILNTFEVDSIFIKDCIVSSQLFWALLKMDNWNQEVFNKWIFRKDYCDSIKYTEKYSKKLMFDRWVYSEDKIYEFQDIDFKATQRNNFAEFMIDFTNIQVLSNYFDFIIIENSFGVIKQELNKLNLEKISNIECKDSLQNLFKNYSKFNYIYSHPFMNDKIINNIMINTSESTYTVLSDLTNHSQELTYFKLADWLINLIFIKYYFVL